MKSAKLLLSFIYLLPMFFGGAVLANELDSTNFKMIGVTTSGGGGVLESTNYNLLSTAGQVSADPRNYSTNYRMDQDPSAAFTAAQPTVQCFETTTEGSTDCISGPAELLAGGMVAICGSGGCYDKARFEIEPYGNPSDTLYMVQISTDDFISDFKCVDGSTFRPKDLGDCDINDFRTESYWESEVFNIKKLQADTDYYIRVPALHGDFTQSDFSIIANTTTGLGEVTFDIDIAPEGGETTESSAPYSVTFAGSDALVAGAATTTATSLIWLDVMSSASGGVAIIQVGEYGGLYSATTTETIVSENENLDSTGAEGFGLQNYYVDYEVSTFLGELSVSPDYSGIGNVVGEVSTNAKKIYEGDGPINGGRLGTYLKARASISRTPATDYSERIYFILVPMY